MEEIYDKEVLQANLEHIENMTVGEIRKTLPDDGAFIIYGNADWAVLKHDEIKLKTKQIMTINEYKKKFLELYEQLEKEHGPVKYIHIEKDDILQPFPPTIITIEF